MYETDNCKCLKANTFKTLIMLVLNLFRDHPGIKKIGMLFLNLPRLMNRKR